MTNNPRQLFYHTQVKVPEGATIGASRSLYAAYLSDTWNIVNGPGQGATIQFQPDGQVSGLPGADRCALGLAGDCATMSNGNDTIWLQKNGVGNTWIFARIDSPVALSDCNRCGCMYDRLLAAWCAIL